MKFFKQACRICSYQLKILRNDYKLYLIPGCLFVYMLNELMPVRSFICSVNEDASPFLFPFIFNDVILTAVLFAVCMLFFIDAPFYNKYQLYALVRCSTSEWIFGQIFYVFTVSAIYVLCLSIICILIIMPKICSSGEWGRIWTTLALTDAGEQFLLTFGVSGYIVFNYSPLQALILVGMLSFLICAFYGLCLWCLNMYVGKIISLIIVFTSILLTTRIKYLPNWIMYFVPSAWADLNNLSKYSMYGINVSKAFLILITGCICFSGIAYHATIHSDIAK